MPRVKKKPIVFESEPKELFPEDKKPDAAKDTPFKERLAAVHANLKNSSAEEPEKKRGRPAGYRKIEGEWVPPGGAEPGTKELFAPENMGELFKGIFPKATSQELAALSVSASSSSRHMPGWMQDWADVGIFASLIVSMTLKYYVYQQKPEKTENATQAPGGEEVKEPEKETPSAPNGVPSPGGRPITGKFFSQSARA